MSDALDRIRQRQRPKVAPRDATLTSQPQDIQTSGHTDLLPFPDIGTQADEIETAESEDIQTSRHTELGKGQGYSGNTETSTHQDTQVSRHTDIMDSEASASKAVCLDASASRHTALQTHRPQDEELQTKRSTFRLEAGLIDRLHTFCRRQGLSREVLIEAMYEYMEGDPEALAQVVAAASEKNEYRQQLANRKRAESMMSKFGGAG